MFEDSFYQINQGEIFVKSQCMQHESSISEFFRSCFLNLGYQTNDPSRRVWTREEKKVIICLADDFNVCGADRSKPPSQWFDSQTVVITDNHIMVPTEYTVCEMPNSYYGIFSYIPTNQNYEPNQRFNFSINRLDTQREIVLLELLSQSNGLEYCLEKDYINFNSWDPLGANNTLLQVQQNFQKYWNPIKSYYQNKYQTIVDQIINHIPIRNHNLSIEEASSKAWLVPVVETYSGNTTVAFSEKVFRALQSPTPWTLFSVTGAIEYLKILGFDVMDDLVDHSYNLITQDSPHGVNKISKFIESSIKNYQRLCGMDVSYIHQRGQQAAQHNQVLLTKFRQQWPSDFANWLPQTVSKIL